MLPLYILKSIKFSGRGITGLLAYLRKGYPDLSPTNSRVILDDLDSMILNEFRKYFPNSDWVPNRNYSNQELAGIGVNAQEGYKDQMEVNFDFVLTTGSTIKSFDVFYEGSSSEIPRQITINNVTQEDILTIYPIPKKMG